MKKFIFTIAAFVFSLSAVAQNADSIRLVNAERECLINISQLYTKIQSF